jgi:hypothetical protein
VGDPASPKPIAPFIIGLAGVAFPFAINAYNAFFENRREAAKLSSLSRQHTSTAPRLPRQAVPTAPGRRSPPFAHRLFAWSGSNALRRSRAGALRGTVCVAPFFVRSPGRVQIAKSSEISAPGHARHFAAALAGEEQQADDRAVGRRGIAGSAPNLANFSVTQNALALGNPFLTGKAANGFRLHRDHPSIRAGGTIGPRRLP